MLAREFSKNCRAASLKNIFKHLRQFFLETDSEDYFSL